MTEILLLRLQGSLSALSERISGVSPRHRHIDAEFVNEEQIFSGKLFLFSAEPGSLRRIGLPRLG